MTTIGYQAFYDCDSLTSIVIPASVTSIGEGAFMFCFSLTDVYYTGDIAGWCGISFGGSYANPMDFADNLYIDGKLVEGELVIPDEVTSIPAYAFSGQAITSIVIPEGVTSIGEEAFSYCYSLTSIVIPDSVTTIGNYAFFYCDSLTDVYYTGTEEQWKAISSGSYNSDLTSAKRYYYSEERPTTTGNYWHYDEDGVTPVIWD